MAPVPMGPRSPTTSLQSRLNTGGSPLKRHTEVHSRQKSNASCPDSTRRHRSQRHSLQVDNRLSQPVPIKEETYQPQYIKPLSVEKKKPTDQNARVAQDTPTRKQFPDRSYSLPVKGTPPKLLTDVSVEDFLRRSHVRGSGPLRYPSSPRSQSSPRSFSKSQTAGEATRLSASSVHVRGLSQNLEQQGISLFNLSPLSIAKSPSVRTTDTVIRTELPQSGSFPSPKLNAAKNPRPNSLYNPDLFATQHGILNQPQASLPPPALKTTVPKRKPVGSATPPPSQPSRVRFALSVQSPSTPGSPELAHAVSLAPARKPLQATHTKKKPKRLSATARPREPSHELKSPSRIPLPVSSPTTSHPPPIQNRFITALAHTAEQDTSRILAAKLKRHTSLARIRNLTPSPTASLYSTTALGEPTKPLAAWIEELCHTRVHNLAISLNDKPSLHPAIEISNKMAPPSTSGNKPISTSKLSTTNNPGSDIDDGYGADAENNNSNRRLSLNTGGGGDLSRGGTSKAKPTPSEELTVMIDDMLSDLNGKFHAVTSEIMAKMDDMARRIDNLEASLSASNGAEEDEGGKDR